MNQNTKNSTQEQQRQGTDLKAYSFRRSKARTSSFAITGVAKRRRGYIECDFRVPERFEVGSAPILGGNGVGKWLEVEVDLGDPRVGSAIWRFGRRRRVHAKLKIGRKCTKCMHDDDYASRLGQLAHLPLFFSYLLTIFL
ncbi:hypothetical protein M0R45_028795 [Rubus argutus]|uniref:Uncharacterized protein n=1 Tax=Rubus argutus TaxID=59490 RepID=A0AAW1WAD7_RUBAR